MIYLTRERLLTSLVNDFSLSAMRGIALHTYGRSIVKFRAHRDISVIILQSLSLKRVNRVEFSFLSAACVQGDKTCANRVIFLEFHILIE